MKLPRLTKEIAEKIDRDHDLTNDEARKRALAEYLGIDESEVENTYTNAFEANGETWLVLTYKEAEDEARMSIESLYDDMGLESFSESFREWIIDNCLDLDEVRNWMLEDYRNYVDDIEYESDSTYGDRLIQELYDEGILTDEDFEVDEDEDILYDTLKDEIDLDEKKEEYIERLTDSMDPVEWLHDIYGDRELGEVLVDNALIDLDEVVEECIRIDGLGHFIASYDGDMVDLSDTLYGFRLN